MDKLFIDIVRKTYDKSLISCLDNIDNIENLLKFIFYVRDYKYGGLGQRTLARKIYRYIFSKYPDLFIKYLYYIPVYGRWDDFYSLFPVDNEEFTKHHYEIIKMIIDILTLDFINMLNNKQITNCCKWMLSENSSLDRKYKFVKLVCNVWGITYKQYRYIIKSLRQYINIIETKICEKKVINYEKITVTQLKRYKKYFIKNDRDRYFNYLVSKMDNFEYKSKIIRPEDIVINYTKYDMFNGKIYSVIEKEWLEYLEILNTIDLSKIVILPDLRGKLDIKKLNISITYSLLTQYDCSKYLLENIYTLYQNFEYFELNDEFIDKIKFLNREKEQIILLTCEKYFYKGYNFPKVFIINLIDTEYYYENNKYCMSISGNNRDILDQILTFGKIDYDKHIDNKLNKYIF